MKSKIFLWLLAIPLLFSGCYPGDISSYEELDIIITSNEEGIDFTKFSTYSMPDTLLIIGSDDPVAMEAAIISQIKTNMTNFGYTEVDENLDKTSDLILIPELVLTDNYIVGGGGCWYSCWCDPFWFPYGCGYYPPYPPSVVKFRTGTIAFHLIDRATVSDTDGEIESIWVGAINGLIRNDISENLVLSYIDQAFTQSSSYLDISN